MMQEIGVGRLELPLDAMERRLIDEYLRAVGHSADALRTQHDEASRQLLVAAARHAAVTLAEVESRSHYVHKLNGQE